MVKSIEFSFSLELDSLIESFYYTDYLMFSLTDLNSFVNIGEMYCHAVDEPDTVSGEYYMQLPVPESSGSSKIDNRKRKLKRNDNSFGSKSVFAKSSNRIEPKTETEKIDLDESSYFDNGFQICENSQFYSGRNSYSNEGRMSTLNNSRSYRKATSESQRHPQFRENRTLIGNQKDPHGIFQSLVPHLPSDLECSKCDYVTTNKGSLIVHYKLRHLGGADLIMTCQICHKQVKTRSYMLKHYRKIHNLTNEAAMNMTNSS